MFRKSETVDWWEKFYKIVGVFGEFDFTWEPVWVESRGKDRAGRVWEGWVFLGTGNVGK